jgi:hypothetical protein
MIREVGILNLLNLKMLYIKANDNGYEGNSEGEGRIFGGVMLVNTKGIIT